MEKTNPTIFHITHWKAGSQWIAEILRNSAPERFVQMEIQIRMAWEVAAR